MRCRFLPFYRFSFNHPLFFAHPRRRFLASVQGNTPFPDPDPFPRSRYLAAATKRNRSLLIFVWTIKPARLSRFRFYTRTFCLLFQREDRHGRQRRDIEALHCERKQKGQRELQLRPGGCGGCHHGFRPCVKWYVFTFIYRDCSIISRPRVFAFMHVAL